MKDGRNAALDAYKLFLAITVAVLHTGYAAKLGYLAVDSFFIINGLMFSKYANDEKSFDWKTQTVRRLKSVWVPYALICTLGTFMEFLFYHNKVLLVQYLPSLMFMPAFYTSRGLQIPLSTGQLWYVPVYLLVFLIFALLLSQQGRDCLDGVAILIAAFSFLVIIAKSESGSWNYSWERGLCGILPIGVPRGMMGFSLGYCLGRVSRTDFVKGMLKWTFCVTVLQMGALILCVYIMWLAPVDFIYNAAYLVASVLFIGTVWAREGAVYQILSVVPKAFTKYSEAIYFCHCFVLAILIKMVGHHPESDRQLLLYLCTVLAEAVLFQKLTDQLQQAVASIPQNSRKET